MFCEAHSPEKQLASFMWITRDRHKPCPGVASVEIHYTRININPWGYAKLLTIWNFGPVNVKLFRLGVTERHDGLSLGMLSGLLRGLGAKKASHLLEMLDLEVGRLFHALHCAT